MKKILLISGPDHFPVGAFRFVKQMVENETAFVKGLFYSGEEHDEHTRRGFMVIEEPVLRQSRNGNLLLNGNQQKFAEACEGVGIRYSIHPNGGTWDMELFIKESRFSDLVVVSDEMFHAAYQVSESNYFMEQILRLSECPVVVVPERHTVIDRLAVAYDGGAESVFALKQFVNLFPYFTDLPTDLVHVKNDATNNVPSPDLLKEYTNVHFDSMFASKLHFDPNRYFATWIENKKNVLLVTGAYSRSTFSNAIRKSFADQILASHTCPVFIAHTAQ
jgi:hypothetical protein